MKTKIKPERVTIGMEVHAELKTLSKMFCGCPSDHFAKKPNTQTCPVCLGLPGALPVPNKKAVIWSLMIGLALNCKINKKSKFDRKHYFYPDLPKGYQISQYDEPLCVNGYLDTSEGRVGITRVHLEEDTGKLQHKKINGKNMTLIDFNRSGVPLVEIVSEPDIHSASQAKEFCQKLRNILRYLEVTDADMEKGSMRLEANTSWGLNLGYKVEIKNLNSFRFVEKAIDYDLDRQRKLLEEGITPKQETRGWSELKNVTVSQRYKETAADYRYFPEPDIPPMEFDDEFINDIKKQIPQLPEEITRKFIKDFGVKDEYALILASKKGKADFALKLFTFGQKQGVKADIIAGYIINQKIDPEKSSPDEIISKLKSLHEEKVADESLLTEWVDEAIAALPRVIEDYKKGKLNALQVIIGKVMQLSRGQADAKTVKSLLEKMLK